MQFVYSAAEDGWWPNDGMSFSTFAYEGNYSACNNAGGVGQYVDVQANTNYVFSCYMHNSTGYDMAVWAGDQQLINPPTPDTWTYLEIPFFSGADTNVFLGFYSNGSNICIDFARLVCGSATSLSPSVPSSNIELYPNPVKDQLFIDFGEIKKAQNLIILNVQGQVMSEVDLTKSSHFMLEVSSYQSGLYFLKMDDGMRISYMKFLKE